MASDLPPAINLCIFPQALFSQFRLYIGFFSLKVQGLGASQSAVFETNIATNYTVGLCVYEVIFFVISNCTAAIDRCWCPLGEEITVPAGSKATSAFLCFCH